VSRLSRLRDVSGVAQLVLQFGEYRGATLFTTAAGPPNAEPIRLASTSSLSRTLMALVAPLDASTPPV
jgi:hypothetical protein